YDFHTTSSRWARRRAAACVGLHIFCGSEPSLQQSRHLSRLTPVLKSNFYARYYSAGGNDRDHLIPKSFRLDPALSGVWGVRSALTRSEYFPATGWIFLRRIRVIHNRCTRLRLTIFRDQRQDSATQVRVASSLDFQNPTFGLC